MAVAEITRAESAERARLVQVESYDISLDLTRGAEVFGSTSVIRFGCRRPGTATHVDLVAEAVREITLNGAPVDPGVTFADGRITLPALAADNELRVVAECRYSADGTGMHRAVDSSDGSTYTYTKFEPAYARRVYANFEQPDLKAAFTIHVTAPCSWTVLSNQPVAAEEEAAGGSRTWHFMATPRISTYLTAVAAGEYEVVSASHTTPRGQVVPLALACRRSMSQHLDAGEVFLLTAQGLDYYTELFRGDYPFAKYDQVFVPEYSAGATENVGCVILTDELLYRSKVTDALRQMRATMVLHEMAHMWFGDLVTMTWWDDLWLNESFAELSGTMSSAEATRFTDAWTTFSFGRKTWGYMQDQLPSTHPIAADVPTLSQAVANFDGISYAKGASVLRQLMAKLGREEFFAGIRSYFAEHAWGNATLGDFLRALEASAGTSLSAWSAAWLETAGPNTLHAEFEVDGAGRFTSFAVRQDAPASYPTLRPHEIAVGLYERKGDELSRTHRAEVHLDAARTDVPELTGVARPDLILLNDGDLDYAIVRFDERSLSTVTESVGGLTDPLSRAVCWGATIDMVRHAELSVPSFVRMLATAAPREPSVAVLQILHTVTDREMTFLGDPLWVPKGKGELAAVATGLLRTAAAGSDHQLTWAQMLSWAAASPDQLDMLQGLLAGEVTFAGLDIDTEMRWALLRRLATTGRAGDAEIDAEAERDATDAGRTHALACRAAIPDPEHKAAAWHLLVETNELGIPGTFAVARSLIQTEHADVLAPYGARYFDALPGIWSSRGEHMRALLGQVLFPHPLASPELLGRIDLFLDGKAPDPALRRVLVERRDVVERALRSRALPAG